MSINSANTIHAPTVDDLLFFVCLFVVSRRHIPDPFNYFVQNIDRIIYVIKDVIVQRRNKKEPILYDDKRNVKTPVLLNKLKNIYMVRLLLID